MTSAPEINELWVIAMIACGGIGLIIHILITVITLPLVFDSKVSHKGKILIVGCILVFLFNGTACLVWFVFRTNVLIPLSILSCKFIYVTNFLFYFMAKYILHCVLIGRTFLVFQDTPFQIKSKTIKIYLIILSIHFFVTIVVWTEGVFPNVLKGVWMEHSICTLFSDNAQNTFTVKLCAILVGAEDFIIGIITLYTILKRFIQMSKMSEISESAHLLHAAIRYGTVCSVAMISTLFLFTLAIPFWPNVTFIIAIDATINSLCVFCVLSKGVFLYNILCFAFRICEKQYFGEGDRKSLIVIHTEPVINKPVIGEGKETCVTKNNIADKVFEEVILHTHVQLKRNYSQPLNVENLKNYMKRNAVSNPNPFV